MNKNTLFVMWGGLFVLCAGLGFVPQPEGWVRPALTALSLVFFLPPFFLLRGGSRETAEALDIADDFGLVVRTAAGEQKTVRSGEVSVRGLYGYVE